MAEFTFGQVETVLATMNHIAGHKRVAFAGRLKMLQKNGVPHRDRPGRGRAGTYTFAQLMQLAIAVEFLQAGLSPQRSAALVQQTWTRYRCTLASRVQAEPPPPDATGEAPYVWTINLEDLRELTEVGTSPYDDLLASMIAIPADLISDQLMIQSEVRPSGRRMLLINGTALADHAVSLISNRFKFASRAELASDITSDNSVEYEWPWLEGMYGDEREYDDVINRGLELRKKHYWSSETDPVTQNGWLARGIVSKLPVHSRRFLAQLGRRYDGAGFYFQPDSGADYEEAKALIDFGLFEPRHGYAAAMTPLGAAAMMIAMVREDWDVGT